MKRALFFLSITVLTLCWSALVSAYQGQESPFTNHQMRGTKNANPNERLKPRRRRGQVGKGKGGNNHVNNANTGYGTSRGKGVNTANIFADPWSMNDSNGTIDDPLDLLDIDDSSPASAPVEAIVGSPTTPPTTAPTAIPSGSPVHAPTLIPSSRPTSSPILAPSHVPTPAPTLSPVPTTAPTAIPSGSPVHAPTLIPSSRPTLSPVPPTPAPITPTTAPSTGSTADRGVVPFEVSNFTSLPHCETTFGVFGSLEGESFTIEFGYELETDPQIIDGDALLALRDKVLPLLETKMNDLILPMIFPRLCVALEMVQQDELQYRLIEGISARPDDEPIVNGNGTAMSCLKLSVPDSDCHVVRGGVSIYGPFDNLYTIDDSAQVLNALKAVMQQDFESLSSVHPSIRRVSYVNLNDDDDDSSVQSITGTTDQGNNDGNRPVLPIVLVSVGGLCFLALGWAYMRGRNNNDNNTSFAADTTEILSPVAPTTPQSRSYAAPYAV